MVRYLDAEEAGKLFPRPLTPKQVRHRINRGIRGIRLKSVTDGRRIYTTEEWVQDFLRDINARRPVPMYHFSEDPHDVLERVRRIKI